MPWSELPGADTKDSQALVTLVPHHSALAGTFQAGLISRATQALLCLEVKGHFILPFILQSPGSLAEVLPDDSNLAFSQSKQILTRQGKTPPPFHLCFDISSVEKIKNAAGLTAAKNVTGLKIRYFS